MAYQRAYQAHVAAGQPLSAVRSAFFLALQLFTHGEPAVGGGWVARAARLLDEQGDDVVERGYLLVHLMHRHITSAELGRRWRCRYRSATTVFVTATPTSSRWGCAVKAGSCS